MSLSIDFQTAFVKIIYNKETLFYLDLTQKPQKKVPQMVPMMNLYFNIRV